MADEPPARGMVRLYHFTALAHLAKIRADGRLTVTESNVSKRREHAGPDVVWLTSNPEPSAHKWGAGSSVDKTEVRITVDLPKREVHRWHEWARRWAIEPKMMRALTATGGSGSWRVIERPIPDCEWVAVDVIDDTGEYVRIAELVDDEGDSHGR